jgi:cobalt/nickel transport system permease protein
MVFLVFAVVAVPDMFMALVGLVITILVLLISRLPLGFVVKRLLVVVPFVLTLCLLILFTNEEGEEIARFAFLSVTSEGLDRSVLIAARAMAAVILVICMLGTMKFETTLKALEHLKVPNKITQLLMFTYRYVFVFIDEFSGMLRSLTSRGFEKRTNLHTITTLSKLIAMLFVRSYERAERVYEAMASRGYEGTMETMTEFKILKRDIIKAGFFVAIGITIIVCSLLEF